MIRIDSDLTTADLTQKLQRFWEHSGRKIDRIEREYDVAQGSPVFTWDGKYTTRGWTEWTEGFVYGSAILQYDATGDDAFLKLGREHTVGRMAPHVSHVGVHDHGFNNVSTYGNLLRLMNERKVAENEWERNFYELALKISGAVQARRFTPTKDGGGFLYSFNGPHSCFIDTIRTVRALMVSHRLGHVLMGEGDTKIDLFQRGLAHAFTNARYNIYYGEGRDSYDLRGRTAHETIFNVNDGNFRCPNAQQGFSGFTTWTRGLSWAMCGYPEELEFLATMPDEAFEAFGGRAEVEKVFLEAAKATCDFFIEHTPVDGVPYWDTGAPNLHKLGDYLDRPADPYNPYEPVDSSAAAIGAQGLLRLGLYLQKKGQQQEGSKYYQAGLTVMNTLLDEPYLSTDDAHQGLLLHVIYHEPNGWDRKPEADKAAHGESAMWGDYHYREAALYLWRLIHDEPYYTFYGCVRDDA